MPLNLTAQPQQRKTSRHSAIYDKTWPLGLNPVSIWRIKRTVQFPTSMSPNKEPVPAKRA